MERVAFQETDCNRQFIPEVLGGGSIHDSFHLAKPGKRFSFLVSRWSFCDFSLPDLRLENKNEKRETRNVFFPCHWLVCQISMRSLTKALPGHILFPVAMPGVGAPSPRRA